MTNGEKIDQVFPDGICPFSKKWLDCDYEEPLTKVNQDFNQDLNNLSSGTRKNSQKLEKDFGESDCISRKAVQTRLKEIINEMETIFADIRENEVNDAVCGLCEYDCHHGLDGYANECPGFEMDDCFKLNEKYKAEWLDISNLPSVTPQEPKWISTSVRKPEKGGEYLLWGKICEDDNDNYCFIGDYYEFDEVFGTEISNYDTKTLGFIDTEIEEYYSVVAWMPLPQAYREAWTYGDVD